MIDGNFCDYCDWVAGAGAQFADCLSSMRETLASVPCTSESGCGGKQAGRG